MMNSNRPLQLSAAVTLLLLGSSACWAGTYATIQEAIDATPDGGTIAVGDGTYSGAGNRDIDFKGKAITLESENGPTNCIIDCQHLGVGFNFHNGEDAQAVVRGFTITNSSGSGIACDDASPTIEDNIITNNSGSGISCTDSVSGPGSSPTITGNTITGNGGGGIHISRYRSSPTIMGNIISGNSDNGIFTNSQANPGPTISNNTITDNTAGGYGGGGIYCYESSPTITGNTISGNTATDGDGGGILCRTTLSYGSISPTINGNTISGNTAASGAGGGIYGYKLWGTIHDNTISGNTATGTTTSSSGGGIYLNHLSMPTIRGNIIRGNTATGTSLPGGGGIALSDESSPTISNNIITGNTAQVGGGIGCYDDCKPSIVNNTIFGNRANGSGGGIYCDCPPTIKNCILWGNEAGHASQLQAHSFISFTPIKVMYCDIQGGWGDADVSSDIAITWVGNIDADPRFANPGHWNGTTWVDGDYHLESTGGRYNPATGQWVVDSMHSPCIDTGDPASDVGDEPAPNGGRINMGAYGGTAEASKSFVTQLCVDARNTTGTEDGSASHPFNTIAEAIASSSDGGTIKVAGSSYSGSLTISGKRVTILGGYVGRATYPGTGNFDAGSRNPDPETNQTVVDGGGAPTEVACQDAAARGSALDGLIFSNGGAIFRGGLVLNRVIARHD